MIWIKACVKCIWYEQYLNFIWLYYTRLLGSIVNIVLFVNIVNKNKQKIADFIKKFRGLSKFSKILYKSNFVGGKF